MGLLSVNSPPSLYRYWGMPRPKCRTLHLALLNFRKFVSEKLSCQWAVFVQQCSWRAEFIVVCQDFPYSFFPFSISQCLSKPRWLECQGCSVSKFWPDAQRCNQKSGPCVSSHRESRRRVCPGWTFTVSLATSNFYLFFKLNWRILIRRTFKRENSRIT